MLQFTKSKSSRNESRMRNLYHCRCEVLIWHMLFAALFLPGSDGLSVTALSPNPTTAIVVPPDIPSVTLSWNYSFNAGETVAAIKIKRVKGGTIYELVDHRPSNPSNPGVKEAFRSHMHFTISGNKIDLVIKNVTVDDGNGFLYECQVISGNFDSKRATVELVVRVAAHNVATVCGQAILGDAMTCTCTADGDPPPGFEWRAPSGTFLHNGSSYTTPLVNQSLNGSYYICVASNGYGPEARGNTTLFNVLDKPSSAHISPHPSVTVNETSSVTLQCQASGGNPAVYSYKWQHNGNNVSDGENGTLELTSVNRNQNGNYTCLGCNVIGCARSTTSLTVQYKPRSAQVSPHPSVTVNETGNVTLQCQGSGGNPAVYWYKWQHNGNDVSGGEDGTLKLTNVNRTQNGNYICLSCNVIGCARNTTSLTVQYKPSSVHISPHPSVTVNETSYVTLQCQASGGNPAVYSYIWQYNGSDISGGENGTLKLTNVNRNQNGNYICLGCNVIGCARNTTSLTVQYKPSEVQVGYLDSQIEFVPKHYVNESSNVTLVCRAVDGVPSLYWYKWQHNGNNINRGEDGTLELTNVNRNENGNYTCLASNIIGYASGIIKLVVRYKPDGVTISNSPATVDETDSLTLQCQGFGGNPTVYSYKWQHNGNDISGGEDGTLELTNVNRTQKGNYICLGCNVIGCARNTTSLTVQYKPSSAHISPHPSVTVNETDNVTLQCQGSGGNPAVYSYKWQHNGSDISGGEDGTLELTNVNRNENGNYTCLAYNKVGYASATSLLIVQYKPSSAHVSPHPSVTVNETSNVTLQCQGSGGNPAVYSYKWQHNGNDISGGDGGTLRLISVNRNQNGNYTCLASNKIGFVEGTTKLIVQSAPSAVNLSSPDITVNETDNVTLQCQGFGGIPAVYSYKWQHNGNDISGGEDGTLELTNVNRNQNGTYKCFARNIFGYATGTASLAVHYKPTVAEVSQSHVTVNETDHVIVTCQGHGGFPTNYRYTWKINGNDVFGGVGGTLNISATRKQNGDLICFANNDAGHAIGTTKLIVQYPPTGVKLSPFPKVKVNVTNNVTLVCEAVDGIPTPTKYKWKRNGKAIFGGEDGSLLLTTVLRNQHNDNYTCFSVNEIGISSTNTTILSVQHKPSQVIITAKPNATVLAGQNLSLTCDTDGNPAPVQFEWKLNDITQEGIYRVLVISKATTGKSGTYSCKAINLLGSATGSKNITVMYNSNSIKGNVTLTNADYIEAYKDINSNESTKLIAEVLPTFVKAAAAKAGNIIALKPGSVIVEFVLYYDKGTSKEEMKKLVRHAVKSGKLGNYEVDPNSLHFPEVEATTPPSPENDSNTLIVVIVVIVVVLLVIIAGGLYWKVKRKRCRKDRKVANGDEHNMEERQLSNTTAVARTGAYNNHGLDLYVEDGPQADMNSKTKKKPEYVYAKVDMSKKSKKKKPGEIMYADLAEFQTQAATQSAKPGEGQQPIKRSQQYQNTDYASITDIIQEREGKMEKVPIGGAPPTGSEPPERPTDEKPAKDDSGTKVTPDDQKEKTSTETTGDETAEPLTSKSFDEGDTKL